MRYSDIAASLNQIARQLTELADKLDKIEEATPTISVPNEATQINKLVLTISEAAKLLSVSTTVMYQLANRDDFPCIQLGRKKLIPRDKLIEWINNHC